MQVHADYSQHMASLGPGESTTLEISTRRSAEVRKKLSLAAGALNEAGDEITGIRARADEQHHSPKQREPDRYGDESEFGRLFSATV